MSQSIEERVAELVGPLVRSMGIELWGVRYRGGGRSATLQIFIDSKEGVSADTCGDVTNLISPALDAADIIGPSYTLEVSSPGLDRILFNREQLRMYVGRKVRLKVHAPVQKRHNFEGTLLEVGDETLRIEDSDGQAEIACSNVAIARAVPELRMPAGKRK